MRETARDWSVLLTEQRLLRSFSLRAMLRTLRISAAPPANTIATANSNRNG